MYMIIIFLVIIIMMILVVLMMMIINCGLKCYYDQSLVALFSSALAALCELSKDGYSTALGGLFPLSHNFFQANLLLLTQLISKLSYQSLTKRKICQKKKKFVSWQQLKEKALHYPCFVKSWTAPEDIVSFTAVSENSKILIHFVLYYLCIYLFIVTAW